MRLVVSINHQRNNRSTAIDRESKQGIQNGEKAMIYMRMGWGGGWALVLSSIVYLRVCIVVRHPADGGQKHINPNPIPATSLLSVSGVFGPSSIRNQPSVFTKTVHSVC